MSNIEFIGQIAPIIQKYAAIYGYKTPSAIIAQACVESAYGTSTLAYKWHNYFGLKCGSGWTGASINLATKEEYSPGTLTSIRDNFRVYVDMDAGVKGYFDFIQYPRYANLRDATTPTQYLTYIKADGYATANTYVNTCLRVVYMYNLEEYDNMNAQPKEPFSATVTGITSGLNVRTGAGTSYPYFEVCGAPFRLPNGVCLAFDDERNGFAKIYGINGWVSSSYLLRA